MKFSEFKKNIIFNLRGRPNGTILAKCTVALDDMINISETHFEWNNKKYDQSNILVHITNVIKDDELWFPEKNNEIPLTMLSNVSLTVWPIHLLEIEESLSSKEIESPELESFTFYQILRNDILKSKYLWFEDIKEEDLSNFVIQNNLFQRNLEGLHTKEAILLKLKECFQKQKTVSFLNENIKKTVYILPKMIEKEKYFQEWELLSQLESYIYL